jgi:hypothetical protein
MVCEPQDQKEALLFYKAMNCFQKIQETQAMVKWLESELVRLDSANRRELVDVEFRQRQGACQAIEKILSMAKDASNKIDKLQGR